MDIDSRNMFADKNKKYYYFAANKKIKTWGMFTLPRSEEVRPIPVTCTHSMMIFDPSLKCYNYHSGMPERFILVMTACHKTVYLQLTNLNVL